MRLLSKLSKNIWTILYDINSLATNTTTEQTMHREKYVIVYVLSQHHTFLAAITRATNLASTVCSLSEHPFLAFCAFHLPIFTHFDSPNVIHQIVKMTLAHIYLNAQIQWWRRMIFEYDTLKLKCSEILSPTTILQKNLIRCKKFDYIVRRMSLCLYIDKVA